MTGEMINFDLPQETKSIIKVIGVGGGGSNAVNQMFAQGIKDVEFVVCNTDEQALAKSPVPIRIQLGESLTEGRGAGNKPEQGEQSAIENLDDVVSVLEDNTKMVFITAGMGGGTGTGAAPIIAKAAHDLGILTVGIVTIPFRWEGPVRFNNAIEGIKKLRDNVDSLLVINNEKLREIHGDLRLSDAFSRADNVLTTAAKGIAEIITVHGYINVDFADVETVMRKSGVSIMGSAKADGEGRSLKAIQEALNSPLLNNNDIDGAKNILLNITSGDEEITMDEIGEITDFVQQVVGMGSNIIWGTGQDASLGDSVSVTIIATGFGAGIIPELGLVEKKEEKKIVNVLIEDGPHEAPEVPKFEVENKSQDVMDIQSVEGFKITQDDVTDEMVQEDNSGLDAESRVERLKRNFDRLKELSHLNTDKISDLENEPAYKRSNVEIDEGTPSEESDISKYTLSEDENKNAKLGTDNSYLNDNVD